MATLTDPVHKRCRDGVAAAIQRLDLEGKIPADRVYSADAYIPQKHVLPCVVCCYSTAENPTGNGTFCRDDVNYPVLVMLLGTGRFRGGEDIGSIEIPDPIRFRDTLRRAFNNQQSAAMLPYVPELYKTMYSGAGMVLDEKHPWFNILSQSVTINAICRVVRGNY